MHKHLQHRSRTHVDVLYLFWGNVLSLGQLEDVLFSIDDSQTAILENRSFVTNAKRLCKYRQITVESPTFSHWPTSPV